MWLVMADTEKKEDTQQDNDGCDLIDDSGIFPLLWLFSVNKLRILMAKAFKGNSLSGSSYKTNFMEVSFVALLNKCDWCK